MTINGFAITYEKQGQLPEVLKLTEFTIDESKLKPNQIVLKALGSPVNPSDIVQITGVYPSAPNLQELDNTSGKKVYVGGNEGVFEVAHVGSDVKDYSIGDRVVAGKVSFGTWRLYALTDTDTKFVKIDKALSVDEAATISVNPPTAYEIFHNYIKDWKEGDWIIQNAGTSQVSQYITQIAKHAGVKTLLIVRDGKSDDELKELYDLGATKIVSESEFLKEDFVKKLPELSNNGRFRLAVNSVGGPTVQQLVSSLSHSGYLVTFGAISGDLTIKYNLGDQLFRNITAVPYWLSYNAQINPNGKLEVLQKITQLYTDKVIQLPKNSVKSVHIDGTLQSFFGVLQSKGKLVIKW